MEKKNRKFFAKNSSINWHRDTDINWYGNTEHFIDIDPQADHTCTNHNANKIDVDVNVGTASGKIQIRIRNMDCI